MVQGKLKELELQLNYVCYDKELITRLSKVWDAYYDLKSEVKKLNIPAVIKSVCVSVISCPYKKDGLCTTDEQCDSKEQTVL